MKNFYVLKQKNELIRVSAETPERAEEIARTRPSITSKGNVMQAFGVDPTDEGIATLILFDNDMTSYKAYEEEL